MNWIALGKALGVFVAVVVAFVAMMAFIYLSPMIGIGFLVAVFSITYIGMLYSMFK